jgi:hypothetical protein
MTGKSSADSRERHAAQGRPELHRQRHSEPGSAEAASTRLAEYSTLSRHHTGKRHPDHANLHEQTAQNPISMGAPNDGSVRGNPEPKTSLTA